MWTTTSRKGAALGLAVGALVGRGAGALVGHGAGVAVGWPRSAGVKIWPQQSTMCASRRMALTAILRADF